MVRERKQQIKIALSDDTRAALELLASKTGRSLAAEVRHLVDFALYSLTFDQRTIEFTRELAILARDVATVSNGVAWHEHPAVRAALAEAIAVWLESSKPSSGEKTVPPNYEPRSVGATVARMRMLKSEETARIADSVLQTAKGVQLVEFKVHSLREKIGAEEKQFKELKEIVERKRAKQKPRKKFKAQPGS